MFYFRSRVIHTGIYLSGWWFDIYTYEVPGIYITGGSVLPAGRGVEGGLVVLPLPIIVQRLFSSALCRSSCTFAALVNVDLDNAAQCWRCDVLCVSINVLRVRVASS